MIRRPFILALILALPATLLNAQEPGGTPQALYGIFGDYTMIRHDADFASLPGVPNCCSRFEEGSGSGVSFGALYENSLGGVFGFSMRAAYTAGSSRLSTLEESAVAVGDQSIPAIFEHRIDAGIASIGLEPMLLVRPFDRIRIHAGGRIALVTRGEYAQREEIIEPYDVGTFADGSRVRNEFGGAIPGGASIEASLLLGVSRDLPLDRSERLLLAPEIFYSHNLTSVARGLAWSSSALRMGIALKIGFHPTIDSIIPAPVAPSLAPVTPPPAPRLAAALRAVSVDADGSEHEDVRIRYEEFISVHMRPLLNYLFFDEGSDRIPARYTLLDTARAERFEVENLHDVETLPTYYHLLNIVGRRMWRHPKATITLVGCNRDEGVEQGNLELSRRRATELFAYLRDVWKIDPARMRIETRNLPAKPSNIDKEDGDIENRRVEIHSDTWEIIEPVITNDTLRKGGPPVLRFYPQTMAEAGADRWRLAVRQSGRMIREFTGEGDPPRSIEWDIRSELGRGISTSEPLDYALELVDNVGGRVLTEPGLIPVEAITIQKKRRERIADRYIDRYALILFDFDRGDLNVANRTIGRFVRERIAPDATTAISGFTDRMGEEDHNLALSRARAASTATALGVPADNATGFGESRLLFDNELPEGRQYCRTVNIVVETPVEE